MQQFFSKSDERTIFSWSNEFNTLTVKLKNEIKRNPIDFIPLMLPFVQEIDNYFGVYL